MQLKRRKWGLWATLYRGKHFKIKLMRFKKGSALSMQKHQLRNELWVFLKGSGTLEIREKDTKGSYFKRKQKGDYENIESGNWHQYRAIKPTWVLEVQYGILCTEKDIERKE